MQRLSGLDAMFFYLETPSSHMHVTGVYVLEPGESGLSFETVRELVASRLPLAAPFRRRLVEVPFKLHHPMWVEDPDFDLDYHVRRACLPTPGGAEELAGFVAQVGGLPLDRARPLWEMYVVEGLEGGRFALVGKMHHAAIDGVSGAEIMATLLDLEADPPERLIVDTWRPEQAPTDADLIALALASLVGHPLRAVKTTRRVVETALHVSEHNRESGIAPPPAPFSAPKTALNGAITPHRRVAFAAQPLDDFKTVKNHFECTVNDVVLAVCGGALRRYLLDHGDLPEDSLVAMVPMSVRTGEEMGEHGNRISAMLTSLATNLEDPVERLETVAEGMRVAKTQERLIGASTLTDWTEFTFPALIGRAARLTGSMRVFDSLRPIFNVTVSNVPGPPFPLFLAGARMVGMYPLGPVTEGVGLNMTVMSYCGMVYFGLNACRETVPAIAEMPKMLHESLDELLQAAGRGARRKPRRARRRKSDGSGDMTPTVTATATATPTPTPTPAAVAGVPADEMRPAG
ncbi:MAG: WS/DGAT/MGAT family O-acyltransferase [Acidimicrobiales bacterium]|jgi:WS/DGAT/MGAT family acyltransferase